MGCICEKSIKEKGNKKIIKNEVIEIKKDEEDNHKKKEIPNNILTYNAANQPIYTRFHRKPQIYPSSFQANKKNQINNLEEENVNSLISNLYKQKKIRGMLDPGAPNNKN